MIGVYLHGSIALKAFNPDSGDIDILVVVRDSIDVETKLEIARDIIEHDRDINAAKNSLVEGLRHIA